MVKVTPTTQLSTVLGEVCSKQKFKPELCHLEYKKKRVDLGLTVRLANLPTGASLDLVFDEAPAASCMLPLIDFCQGVTHDTPQRTRSSR